MSTAMILLLVIGAVLVAAYALWDFGAAHWVAGFGRLVLRAVTFGRIRLQPEVNESAAIGVAAATLLGIFILFLIVASRVN